ncbi:MSP domain-containing protein [Lineolata rhizophorae]|uniref:MSP domain-containing protein n=1 Tax=Lineolata rhizophorae TaxID=578093 RepID=A0A6A6PBS6_9PEZI|nr:MSP domain-containing protein [Lineolata rhizophorae]
MSIELTPPELAFKRPFNHEVSQVLRLRNPNSDPVAFKVKTTAPKQYCVRPNSGRIEGGGEVEVQVLLQAMKEDPPLDAKCKDKFLVQSVAVAADREFTSVQTVWSSIESTSRSSIQEKKIRVVFLPPDNVTSTPPKPHTNGVSSPEGNTIYPSPMSEYGSVPPKGPVLKPESRPADSKHLGDAVSSAHNPAASSQPSIKSEIKAEPASSFEDSKDQVSRDEGLRQRKTGSGGTEQKSGPAGGGMGLQQPAQAAGVPVQIVAALCLLSFLLAYFFF